LSIAAMPSRSRRLSSMSRREILGVIDGSLSALAALGPPAEDLCAVSRWDSGKDGLVLDPAG
jgi:hypothetical protein